MIIGTTREAQAPQTTQLQALVPGVVQTRSAAGKHVIAVDFTKFPTTLLRDGIHPTDEGPDPVRDITTNGGPDENIPPLDWGTSPITVKSPSEIFEAGKIASRDSRKICKVNPHWYSTGKLASGRGVNGDFKFHSKWESVGQVMPATGLDPKYARLHDMDGDGKAVWIDPDTGAIRCWLNKYPNAWVKAGEDGLIADGRGPSDSIFLADMNGDGLDDYLVVNPDDGSADIYWNHGPDAGWAHGWKFVEGGQVVSGVPHANWKTLRLADMNGDGRSDYLTVGIRGSAALWLNEGSQGTDVKWLEQGGITAGSGVTDLDTIIFADIDGDGRDDYLIFDDEAGISGYLNIMTQKSGVPLFAKQEGNQPIATGIENTKNWRDIRIADVDGDGKADYSYIASDGSVHLWLNRGSADTSRASDSVVFADIDGDTIDDYVILDHDTGSISGPDEGMGWKFEALNGGEPIASGRAPASQILFADINRDDLDDYLYADYIFLKPNGGTTIYRNNWSEGGPGNYFVPFPEMDASGINENPDEIQFVDINGDEKADYVWTRSIDGVAKVWYNNYEFKEEGQEDKSRYGWREGGVFASGVGANGDNVRYAIMDKSGRSSYVVLDPATGAPAAWLNGCDDKGDSPRGPVICDGGVANNPYHPAGDSFGWAVYIPEPIGLTPAYEVQECGNHFLNVLKKQGGCETPTSWGCDAWGRGVKLQFDTSIFCGKGQVQKAIWDSTNPQNGGECINRGNSQDEWSGKSPFDILLGILNLLPGPSKGKN
ncbi:hypothetical protein ACLOAV_007815 [Pseudogymnoascus australis]